MKMKNIMSSPVYIVEPDETVAHARNLMMRHKVGSILVVDDPLILGIFTKSDLNMKLFEEEAAWKRRPIDQIPIKSVMTADVVTLSPNASIAEAAKLMVEKNIDHIPIFEKEVLGIVSKTDLIRFAAESATNGRVGDAMTGKAVVVNTNHTLNHVIDEMEKSDVQKVIVMDNQEKAVGIVSIKDLSASELIGSDGKRSIRGSKKSSSKAARYALDIPFIAEDIMTNIVVADVSESIASAAKKIIDNNVVSLPVTKNGKVSGMISKNDILRWLTENHDA
ncbi:CBS domain-containing protein [Methanimicrococcus blatticola]|uniref:CBS domain protein n=1 Tax=Methanimicrococcus blatticola TaxID=91560 RepID=A0A484F5X2_9EURY|nr:CBS domain-containing protein [Methanimicrococcus blatticola]MBZ3936169.1 CBS domain-containing protein [Methanimicrococcus blatticola]MCC2508412.1 CBS domain-containing protein [Methanimicrococcus blatticola]TDQ70135.1 CBS domain protein [Methanimicrococcus blatticola]